MVKFLMSTAFLFAMFVMGGSAYLNVDVKDALLLEGGAYLRPDAY